MQSLVQQRNVRTPFLVAWRNYCHCYAGHQRIATSPTLFLSSCPVNPIPTCSQARYDRHSLRRTPCTFISQFHTSAVALQGLIYNGNPDHSPRLLVVQPRVHPPAVLKAQLLEALRLADSLEKLRGDEEENDEKGEEDLPPHILVQSPEVSKGKKRRKRARADAYFGSGTIENVGAHAAAVESQHGLDAIFVNTTLTAVQQRNLERAWGKPVLDRVGLIIEIFGAHAETKEAKLQVELAALNYKRSRLVRMPSKEGRMAFGMDFESEVVSGRGRGTGGRGFISGAGETELQLQRRRISERKDRLLTMLEEVRRTRALHRESRRRQGIGGHGKRLIFVAVVGYTNAGKSSLVAALSHSNLYVEDKLFATLDPRSRSVTLPSGQTVILSDTVGFISDLPIQLVQAFHATLEEVVEADFLLHVIDSSAFNAEEQRVAVLQVLESIGVSKDKIKSCMIEVWNKVDLMEKPSGDDKSEDLLKLGANVGVNLLHGDCEKDDGDEEEGDEEEAASDHEENLHTVLASDDDDNDHKYGYMGRATSDDTTEEYKGASWFYEGIPRVATSVVQGTGLKELLELLDRQLLSAQKSHTQSES